MDFVISKKIVKMKKKSFREQMFVNMATITVTMNITIKPYTDKSFVGRGERKLLFCPTAIGEEEKGREAEKVDTKAADMGIPEEVIRAYIERNYSEYLPKDIPCTDRELEQMGIPKPKLEKCPCGKGKEPNGNCSDCSEKICNHCMKWGDRCASCSDLMMCKKVNPILVGIGSNRQRPAEYYIGTEEEYNIRRDQFFTKWYPIYNPVVDKIPSRFDDKIKWKEVRDSL